MQDYVNVLQLLYERYVQLHPFDSPAIQEGHQKLEQKTQNLTLKDRNEIFKIVCDLCAENERLAFVTGVQTGFALKEELK